MGMKGMKLKGKIPRECKEIDFFPDNEAKPKGGFRDVFLFVRRTERNRFGMRDRSRANCKYARAVCVGQ